MTNKDLIKHLLDLQLDKEVLLSYPKEHIDDMGNKCEGYAFHIDSVESNGFGICINFTDWRDTEKDYERPHGEWIKGQEIYREMLSDTVLHIEYKDYTCSSCGLVLDHLLYNCDGSPFYKYCPNCGVKMEVKE